MPLCSLINPWRTTTEPCTWLRPHSAVGREPGAACRARRRPVHPRPLRLTTGRAAPRRGRRRRLGAIRERRRVIDAEPFAELRPRPGRATLVRPDGIIAWRSRGPADAARSRVRSRRRSRWTRTAYETSTDDEDGDVRGRHSRRRTGIRQPLVRYAHLDHVTAVAQEARRVAVRADALKGVPVTMMSPGSSGASNVLQEGDQADAAEEDHPVGRACWTCSPLTCAVSSSRTRRRIVPSSTRIGRPPARNACPATCRPSIARSGSAGRAR